MSGTKLTKPHDAEIKHLTWNKYFHSASLLMCVWTHVLARLWRMKRVRNTLDCMIASVIFFWPLLLSLWCFMIFLCAESQFINCFNMIKNRIALFPCPFIQSGPRCPSCHSSGVQMKLILPHHQSAKIQIAIANIIYRTKYSLFLYHLAIDFILYKNKWQKIVET